MPYLHETDGSLLIRGDSRKIPLADGVVQCTVTSVPYFGLRDYETGRWVGGDENCEHSFQVPGRGGDPDRKKGYGHPTAGGNRGGDRSAGCACGAQWRDLQIGLESSINLYLAEMIRVFREVWRVMRDDATLWLNVGDSFATGTKARRGPTTTEGADVPASWKGRNQEIRVGTPDGVKTKELLGIPFRLVLALQADGWYYRQDNIWCKNNAITESMKDRTTRAHEYVFHLTKKSKYYYDIHSTREPLDFAVDGVRAYGKNKRSWWMISKVGYKGAHYATFPIKLPEVCISAGSSEKGQCRKCGKPWRRLVRSVRQATRPGTDSKINRASANGDSLCERHNGLVIGNRDPLRHNTVYYHVGWEPGCKCQDAGEPVPQIVLDPFAGSAATGQMARLLGRRFVGVELSDRYLKEQAKGRVQKGERPHKGEGLAHIIPSPAQPSLFPED